MQQNELATAEQPLRALDSAIATLKKAEGAYINDDCMELTDSLTELKGNSFALSSCKYTALRCLVLCKEPSDMSVREHMKRLKTMRAEKRQMLEAPLPKVAPLSSNIVILQSVGFTGPFTVPSEVAKPIISKVMMMTKQGNIEAFVEFSERLLAIACRSETNREYLLRVFLPSSNSLVRLSLYKSKGAKLLTHPLHPLVRNIVEITGYKGNPANVIVDKKDFIVMLCNTITAFEADVPAQALLNIFTYLATEFFTDQFVCCNPQGSHRRYLALPTLLKLANLVSKVLSGTNDNVQEWEIRLVKRFAVVLMRLTKAYNLELIHGSYNLKDIK